MKVAILLSVLKNSNLHLPDCFHTTSCFFRRLWKGCVQQQS